MQTKGAPPLLPAVLYAAKSTEDRHGSIPDQRCCDDTEATGPYSREAEASARLGHLVHDPLKLLQRGT